MLPINKLSEKILAIKKKSCGDAIPVICDLDVHLKTNNLKQNLTHAVNISKMKIIKENY